MLKVDIMFVRENSLVAMLVTFGQGHTATRMAELSKNHSWITTGFVF